MAKGMALMVGVAILVMGVAEKSPSLQDLRYAEWRLDELHEVVKDQEKVVRHLENLQSCGAEDRECRSANLLVVQKIKQAQSSKVRRIEESMPVTDRVYPEAVVEARSNIVAIGFLPSQSISSSGKFGIAADAAGNLHLFNSSGMILASHPTGHAGGASALAIDQKAVGDLKIVTANKEGEVRVHVLNGPPRGRRRGANNDSLIETSVWKPHFETAHVWSPSAVPTMKGLLPRQNTANFTDTGSSRITALDFVYRGRLTNVLVGDELGRLSQHLINGTLLSSAVVRGGGPIRCLKAWKSTAAICTGQGIQFYETKERRLLSQKCMRLSYVDEGLPEILGVMEEVEEEDLNVSNSTRRRKKIPASTSRSSAQGMEMGIHSLAADPFNENVYYAGTEGGGILSLQMRGEKSRIRCSVMHHFNLSVSAVSSGKYLPISVAAVQGYLLALSSLSSPSISVFNISQLTRPRLPEFVLFFPLEVAGNIPLQLVSDQHSKFAFLTGDREAQLWTCKLVFYPQKDWNISWFNTMRHPLLLGAAAMFFMWQMRKKKTETGGPNAEDLAELQNILRGVGGSQFGGGGGGGGGGAANMWERATADAARRRTGMGGRGMYDY